LVDWHAKILSLLGNDPFRANEGPGIMVLGNVAGNPFGGAPAGIDGFTILGALAGGGIDVNSDVDSLTISNNRITGNQGNYAGGIAVGTPGVASNNSNLVIRDNAILKNGGIQGPGGISIYTGADGYLVENNLIMGNFSRFNGGGIGHIGLSDGSVIRGNQIVLNEINNGANVAGAGDGAGIYLGGDVLAAEGAGSVTIEANLIQANLSGSGYGGGIRTFAFDDATQGNTLEIVNNIIANNVAGVAAGGISLQDVSNATLVHNTIVNNDSAPVGANAFVAGQLDSLPQPAGVTVVNSTATLENNIVLHNRAFAYDHTLNAMQGGLTFSNYWDLNGTMTVSTTLLTNLSGASNGGVNYTGNGNQAFFAAPLFVREYSNELVTAAVLDEGGNAITLKFTNLDISAGDYHLRSLSQPIDQGSVIGVATDIDGDTRDALPDLGADEYAVGAPITNNLFVETLYLDMLGRAGDLPGVQYWTGQLDAGAMSRAEVVAVFMGSSEYTNRVPPIARLYFAAFQRIPDYGGLLYWVNVHAQGTPLATIADAFATSPEFLATYGALSNEAYVTLLYQNVLGRAPDAGGLAYWVGQLDSGTKTRGDVLAGFAESAEFQALAANEVYVVGVYAGLLLRSPGQGEFDNWMTFLDGGGSQLVFIENILASGEYAARF
jgi:hypothetical protein